MKINNVHTPAAEEMKDIFKKVRKIFITPTIRVDEEDTTDSESEKLDVAQGGKLESEEDVYELNMNKQKKY